MSNRPRLNVPPALASALAWAAYDLYWAPKSGKANVEARNAVSDALLVIHGAPFGFRGPLNPDAPKYPLGPDPVVMKACERFADEIAADTLATAGATYDANALATKSREERTKARTVIASLSEDRARATVFHGEQAAFAALIRAHHDWPDCYFRLHTADTPGTFEIAAHHYAGGPQRYIIERGA